MKYQREEVPTSAHKRNWGSFWKLLSKGITLAASVSFHYATVGGDPPLAAVCGALGAHLPTQGGSPRKLVLRQRMSSGRLARAVLWDHRLWEERELPCWPDDA